MGGAAKAKGSTAVGLRPGAAPSRAAMARCWQGAGSTWRCRSNSHYKEYTIVAPQGEVCNASVETARSHLERRVGKKKL